MCFVPCFGPRLSSSRLANLFAASLYTLHRICPPFPFFAPRNALVPSFSYVYSRSSRFSLVFSFLSRLFRLFLAFFAPRLSFIAPFFSLLLLSYASDLLRSCGITIRFYGRSVRYVVVITAATPTGRAGEPRVDKSKVCVVERVGPGNDEDKRRAATSESANMMTGRKDD